eukprot:TRINITY_DN34635_c0_g1_i1.p1 TRINITY_DN34635_c0_g1~~TRINITY_DN34635_c0_g1_i1.p1  ORF type:complete len:100 (-),score=2.37 TRINITY_DN34635_c0_g1_i1:961-1260(-)
MKPCEVGFFVISYPSLYFTVKSSINCLQFTPMFSDTKQIVHSAAIYLCMYQLSYLTDISFSGFSFSQFVSCMWHHYYNKCCIRRCFLYLFLASFCVLFP